jgi:hypothetical protein
MNMTKKQKLELEQAQKLAVCHERNAKYYENMWRDSINAHAATRKNHAEEMQKFKKEIGNEIGDLVNKSLQSTQVAILKAERDTISQAFKYLADNLTLTK